MPDQQDQDCRQNPVTLVFIDERLESQYTLHQITEEFMVEDKWWVVALVSSFAVQQISVQLAPWLIPGPRQWTFYAYSVALVLHVLVAYCLPRHVCVRYRNIIALVVRTCLMVVHIRPFLLQPLGQVTWGVTSTDTCFIKRYLSSTGVLYYGGLALVVRLPLRMHLCLQGIITMLSIWLNNEEACTFLGQDGIPCGFQSSDGAACKNTAEAFMKERFTEVFGQISYVHGFLMPSGHDSSEQVPQDPRVLCLIVITFLKLMLGCVIPTLVVYTLEWLSRANFLEIAQEADRTVQAAPGRRLCVFQVAYHAAIRVMQFLALTCIAWELALLNLLGANLGQQRSN